MKINKQKAMHLWEKEYGKRDFATDFNGKLMYKKAYGKPGYCIKDESGKKVNCGWNVHHIQPKANGGTDAMSNLTCTNYATNQGAGNKITYWIDGSKYQVRKDKQTKSYKIISL